MERFVLNTQPIRDLVEEFGVVTLQADWTKKDEETGKVLDQLGGRQLPILAIFSAKDPTNPILLRGIYRQRTLIEKLEQAGPSKSNSEKMPRDEELETKTMPTAHDGNELSWKPPSQERLDRR